MTTNAGASDMAREGIGFGQFTREDVPEEAVQNLFTPEFRNRLVAIVPFGYMPTELVARVVAHSSLPLEMQLADRNVQILRAHAVRNMQYDQTLTNPFVQHPTCPPP